MIWGSIRFNSFCLQLEILGQTGLGDSWSGESPSPSSPGGGAFPIKVGDIIASPAGGEETAHQIINTSEEELRLLAVGTKLSPEIAEYPDTNRFGLLASLAPDETGKPRTMMYVGNEGDSLYYREVNRWTVIFCGCSNLYEASFSQVFSKFAGAWRVDD